MTHLRIPSREIFLNGIVKLLPPLPISKHLAGKAKNSKAKINIALAEAGQNLALGADMPRQVGASKVRLAYKSNADAGAVIELPSARDRSFPT